MCMPEGRGLRTPTPVAEMESQELVTVSSSSCEPEGSDATWVSAPQPSVDVAVPTHHGRCSPGLTDPGRSRPAGLCREPWAPCAQRALHSGTAC